MTNEQRTAAVERLRADLTVYGRPAAAAAVLSRVQGLPPDLDAEAFASRCAAIAREVWEGECRRAQEAVDATHVAWLRAFTDPVVH